MTLGGFCCCRRHLRVQLRHVSDGFIESGRDLVFNGHCCALLGLEPTLSSLLLELYSLLALCRRVRRVFHLARTHGVLAESRLRLVEPPNGDAPRLQRSGAPESTSAGGTASTPSSPAGSAAATPYLAGRRRLATAGSAADSPACIATGAPACPARASCLSCGVRLATRLAPSRAAPYLLCREPPASYCSTAASPASRRAEWCRNPYTCSPRWSCRASCSTRTQPRVSTVPVAACEPSDRDRGTHFRFVKVVLNASAKHSSRVPVACSRLNPKLRAQARVSGLAQDTQTTHGGATSVQ